MKKNMVVPGWKMKLNVSKFKPSMLGRRPIAGPSGRSFWMLLSVFLKRSSVWPARAHSTTLSRLSMRQKAMVMKRDVSMSLKMLSFSLRSRSSKLWNCVQRLRRTLRVMFMIIQAGRPFPLASAITPRVRWSSISM